MRILTVEFVGKLWASDYLVWHFELLNVSSCGLPIYLEDLKFNGFSRDFEISNLLMDHPKDASGAQNDDYAGDNKRDDK